MEQELLRRGQKVVLETKKGERVWRHTFVIDHASPELLFLTPLTEGEVVSVYEVGDKVLCYIPTPVRAYQFESVVVQNRLDTVPYIVLERPEQLRPVQRRRFFRVRVLHSVKLLPISNENEASLDQPVEAYGTDINGGGVGIRLDLRKIPPTFQLREHQRLKLIISLPPVEKAFPQGLTAELVGEILWIRHNGRSLRIGIAFTNIDRKLQERVIAWCFAYQCKLLRLGLWRDEV
jgi:c-di-GMP-binding flagellar brake protein YcgR